MKPPRASLVSTLLAGFVAAVGLSAVGVLMRVLFGAPLPFEALFNSVTQFLGTPAMFQIVHATVEIHQCTNKTASGAIAPLMARHCLAYDFFRILRSLPEKPLIFQVS